MLIRMKKTAQQIANETLLKIAEPSMTFTQALQRPEVQQWATNAGMEFAVPPGASVVNMAGRSAGGLLSRSFPRAVQAARGIRAEVPGVLRGYGAAVKGLFQRRPVVAAGKIQKPTVHSEVTKDMAIDAAVPSRKPVEATVPHTQDPTLRPGNMDATVAGPRKAAQPAFNPANVPKSQKLLAQDARFSAKTPAEHAAEGNRIDWKRWNVDKANALLNRAAYNPPRGNTPAPLPPAAHRAAAGGVAASHTRTGNTDAPTSQ